ncbi:MAG: hypothetical protein PW789_11415 [Edaphobacter sp.]|uniref:hypothetical protein n=1 Tax=Edaphobacter sp. TaxID=1934404 RepID=UPI0023901A32|nr:hypothetical protein [Edaphobacter sp.]MDE1177193.1 hypothetical protein [Edaphobacter sp.]
MSVPPARSVLAFAGCGLFALSSVAQQPSPSQQDRALPDVATLMHEVEDHQRTLEAIQKDYLYHEDARREDADGKQIEHQEFDVFWLNGVEIHKLTRKNDRDLTADEQKKESDRIDKEIAKAKERKQKAAQKGQETDSHGYEEVTVSRFLSLGSFTNPRRMTMDGRDTIVIDYTGDPKAKTHNRLEDVIRNLAGTIWVDEQDRTIARLEGHFINSYKIGAGLVMNIRKDTSFAIRQKKINNEVWLPAEITGRGAARVMLFVSFSGTIRVTDSEYRKFKTSSKILPGLSTIDDNPANNESPSKTPPDSSPTPPQ